MDAERPDTALLQEADALAAAGDRGAAIAVLERHIAQSPRAFEARLKLSRLFFAEARFDDAVRALRAAEAVDPLGAQFSQIQHCIQSRQLERAGAIAQAMLDTIPGHPRAAFTLAHLAQSRGDFEGAVAVLRDSLAHAPANPVLCAMLAGALEQCGAYAEALDAAAEMVRIEENFDSLLALITLQLRYGRNEAALAACDRAEPYCGGDARRLAALHHMRGQLYRILGRREACERAFRDSLAADPLNASAWWGLADLKTHRFSEADQAAMEHLERQPGLPPAQRSLAAFARAKALEETAGLEAGLPAYLRANELHPHRDFPADRFEAAAERLVSSFTREALAERAPSTGGPTPIFIVGLPRSGSTLVEQILASHSQIEGTMEQPTLPAIKRKAHLECVKQFGADYLSTVGGLTEDDLAGLGRAYMTEGRLFRTGDHAFFTDKLPHNFEHVGLIYKILPRAIIIDVRRHPMDCGLSLLRQHFAQGVEYSYSPQAIARYYNGYLKIMDHWDAVLPGQVLHLQYERLVQNPEAEIGRMLSHAGLDFEPACLNFHQTRRAVRTASSEQVRTPLFTSGIGTWKTVEAGLSDLKNALGAATLARFEGLD